MITQKFQYKPIPRKNIDGKRKYLTPDNRQVFSVTTILDATKTEEKKLALENWRKNVGYANAQAITTKAAGHGTKIHSYLEKFIETDELIIPGSHPLAQQANKMAKVIIDNGFNNHITEIYGSETQLYFPELFSGTTDCVAIYDKELSICDFKQSNKLKRKEWIEDYFLQIAAYCLAHDELYGTKVKQGIIMMCTQDLEYQQWILSGIELEKMKDVWWSRVEKFYIG